MKIIHIMKKQKFTIPVSEFYDLYFNNGEHEICYLNQQGATSLIQSNLSIPQKELFFGKNLIKNVVRFYDTVKGYDYIVFHSLLFKYWLRFFLASCDKLCKKMVWIEWGADLYTWRVTGKGILGKFLNKMERKLRTKCKTAVCIFPPDCEYYQQQFPNSKAKLFYAPYCGGRIPEEYKEYDSYSRLKESRCNDETIYIQVGHSATSMVDHIKTLSTLKRFADRDIKILLPLNYGDTEYADKVQKYAEETFSGKVICLREMLSAEEYFEMIKRIDIAVFHTFRQIALGNIRRMIFRNVKIYLPKESIMYHYFKENGAPVQEVENLEECDFDTFISDAVIDDEDHFRKYIASYSDMEEKVGQWNVIYDDLRDALRMKGNNK